LSVGIANVLIRSWYAARSLRTQLGELVERHAEDDGQHHPLCQHQTACRIDWESFIVIQEETSSFESISPALVHSAVWTALPMEFDAYLGEERFGILSRESFVTRNAQTLKEGATEHTRLSGCPSERKLFVLGLEVAVFLPLEETGQPG
jgi:hypothetical protein